MFRQVFLCAALYAPLCAHAAVSAAPQGEEFKQNSINGEVKDALGRPVAGARITLQDADGVVTGTANSDAGGRFVFSLLAAGTYAVLAEKEGFDTGSSIATLVDGAVSTTVTLAATGALEINIAAARLEKPRNGATPQTGGSGYRFDADDVERLPQGSSTPLNQVLLQAPGVANDSFGQLHVRGDHGNMQYRINGVALPDSINSFGQELDARFAQKIDLLTGVLPARYGFRTAGVVEIETKSRFESGGRADLYVGSNNTFNPGIEYGGTRGNIAYFVDGSFLRNDAGVENPAPTANPIHDQTSQARGFGYLSLMPDATTRLSLMLGSYDGRFQVPDNPGQPTYVSRNGPLGSLPAIYDSATLNDRQREISRFAVLALQGAPGDKIDYQLSLLARYSSSHYLPDIAGNLAFNGAASDVFKSSLNTGIQIDGSYRLSESHTLFTGLVFNSENIESNNNATVINLTTASQQAISDNTRKNGNTLLGLYMQDEWKASEKLTVNYGARFDRVDAYVNEQQFSPRLGLTYKSSNHTTWHGGYARYFTPPPAELVSLTDQALFNNTTGAAPGANSQVMAERANYLDAGATHQLTPALNLGVDSFYRKSSNLVDEGRFGPALIMTPFNYKDGKIYGVELTANFNTGDFSAYANLARTVSMGKNIISGQYLFPQAVLDYAAANWVNVDHEQALTASIGGSYVWSGTRLNGNLLFASGLRNGFANTTSLPSYAVLNLGAGRRVNFNEPVEARLVLNNVFDRVYEIRDGTGVGVFAPQYGLRRGVFFGLSKAI